MKDINNQHYPPMRNFSLSRSRQQIVIFTQKYSSYPPKRPHVYKPVVIISHHSCHHSNDAIFQILSTDYLQYINKSVCFYYRFAHHIKEKQKCYKGFPFCQSPLDCYVLTSSHVRIKKYTFVIIIIIFNLY